jgi:hypothetical protein
MANTALFYPHLYPSERSLKLAALSWDSVYTLRPEGSPPPPPAIDELNAALGSVLHDADFRRASDDYRLQVEFGRWVDARIEAIQASPRTPGREIPEVTELFASRMGVGPGFARLDDLGLLQHDGSGHILVPEDVGLHYLSLCAAHVADKDRRDLAASDQDFTDTIFRNARAQGARVATATVEALLPVGLDELEPVRIAELRNELRLERRSHFTDVADFVDEFERIASAGEWERLERDAVEQAQRAAEGARKAARRARVELAGQAISISLTPPAIASAVASLLGVGLFVPAGIGVALAVVGAQAYLKYREDSEQVPDRWSYVVKLGRSLE